MFQDSSLPFEEVWPFFPFFFFNLKSNLLTTDYLSFPHSLSIFSLNIEFWVDCSLPSVLCLIDVRIFFFAKFLFLLSSLITGMDFFEFTLFHICWASWICSLMSFTRFKNFSAVISPHAFFRPARSPPAGMSVSDCPVCPLVLSCCHCCSDWVISIDLLQTYSLSSPFWY